VMSHWTHPSEIIQSAAQSFRIDKWADQEHRPEVWVEKDALVGIVERICRELDIPFLACRGYTSQSEMWSSAMRLQRLADECGQTPIILHFGDHDPSGIDMTRDITDRLRMFMGGIEVRRVALNMNQVEEFNPPPNPAKSTDARFSSYLELFGDESWELDALEPAVLVQLITDNVLEMRDEEKWERSVAREAEYIAQLDDAADRWDEVADFLNNGE